MAKALYRKYRSRSFDEVVGQEHITETLKRALKKGAVSHAYLFTGPRGVGKTSIARILAHAINDLPYDEEATHLDIIEIDAASNRRIDEIRDLRDKVHIAPTSAKYKVYIIDEVHMLTREAFNALLKTLEEPPEHAVFILATTEAHKVPDTITSRTQKFTFKPITTEKAIEHLRTIAAQEKLDIDDEALKLLSEHGRGSFRDSISMLDQLAGLSEKKVGSEEVRLLLGIPDEALIDSIIMTIVDADMEGLFKNVQRLREQGIDSGRAARAISEKLRSELMTDTPRLPKAQSIALLKQLLPLTTSSNDHIGLEVSILELMHPLVIEEKSHHHEKQALRPKHKISEPAETDTVPSKEISPKAEVQPASSGEELQASESNESPESNAKSDVGQSTSEPTPTAQAFDPERWNTCLHAIKTKYNTLYGVLRMAQPQLETDDSLTLRFNFGFHKKQIDNPKNTTIIREYLHKHFGIESFKTIVDKQAKAASAESTPAVQKAPEPVIEDNAISSVSNIFGGAELLES